MLNEITSQIKECSLVGHPVCTLTAHISKDSPLLGWKNMASGPSPKRYKQLY